MSGRLMPRAPVMGSCMALSPEMSAHPACPEVIRSYTPLLLASVGEHATSYLARVQPPGVEAPSAPHAANALVRPARPRAARLQIVRLTMTTSVLREGADSTPRGCG